jgi:hypothetical protein
MQLQLIPAEQRVTPVLISFTRILTPRADKLMQRHQER